MHNPFAQKVGLRLANRRSTRWRTRSLLNGHPGREGFLFHDGHNQAVHQGAPGLLGLLEGRRVVERWKPDVVRWLDTSEHFFFHVMDEFAGQSYFADVQLEVERIQASDATPEERNRSLFDYLAVLAGELERGDASRSGGRPVRLTRVTARQRAGSGRSIVSLNGVWTAYYRRGPGRYVEKEVRLPVNWELLPGIANYSGSMRFSKAVLVPRSLRGKRLSLAFSGVDYFTELWVNGHHVGGNEGYFVPFELDVSPFLHYGDSNVLRLCVTSPNEPAGGGIHVSSGWDDFSPASSFPNRKTLVKGTLGHHDAKRGGAWSSLTGQDGNTGGVWNDVQLHVTGPVHFGARQPRITTLSLAPSSGQEARARVEMRFTVQNSTGAAADATLEVVVEPANFSGASHRLERPIVLSPGSNEVVLTEDLEPISLWQPADHGFPHLYSVKARLEAEGPVADDARVETGFRVLSVSAIGESTGENGAFVVNGKPVVVRGTNLLPTYWLSEYGQSGVAEDFSLLRQAGFNSILIHNLVGPRRLYEHANRSGVLVVQMFPLQWSYQETPELVASAKRQIRAMADLLHNDPSVVSYEVHNEPDLRTADDLDNRFFDMELHATLRDADAHRWATTFSGGNHAYPGQYYPLRDDNSFETLPGRFLESEFHGRRFSRHVNMPTEFGIQALPNEGLTRRILSEARVRHVLSRMRTDPRWLAAGGDSWETANTVIEESKETLGGGNWTGALDAFDWRHLWKLGAHRHLLEQLEQDPRTERARFQHERLSLQLALLLLDVLHYGAFKGENFWFGLWKPSRTLAELIEMSQNRQYRLHKDAIENYLNAGAYGAVVGYFGFMFRDSDWQAPTWGVVDADWVPKKAYRAYQESNQPIRVTLPQALRSPVKLPGDSWFGAEDASGPGHDAVTARPWLGAEVMVANDTTRAVPGARIDVWLEDRDRRPVSLAAPSGRHTARYQLPVDLPAQDAYSYFERSPERRKESPPSEWTISDSTDPGRYWLRAGVTAPDGRTLSTNCYELFVPDVRFPVLGRLSESQLATLLDGAPGNSGFHYWQDGSVVHKADPGLRGFVSGFKDAQAKGIHLYETVQGEHFFRHILDELARTDHGGFLLDEIWTIRSEILSPAEKARVLMRYCELFCQRAEQRLAGGWSDDSHALPITGSSAAPRRLARKTRPLTWTLGRSRLDPRRRAVGEDLPSLRSVLTGLALSRERLRSRPFSRPSSSPRWR